MNGVRSTFMRRGYLLTALSALLLLAASSGTASAQSIGFVGDSGTVSETASLESGALEAPHEITVRVSGLRPPGAGRDTSDLGTLSLTASETVSVVKINANGSRTPTTGATELGDTASTTILVPGDFDSRDEVVLLVAQSATGVRDSNWYDEEIKLTLSTDEAGVTIPQNVYTLTVDDQNVAPVAKFDAPSFTLTEGSDRAVSLDIVSGTTGRADVTIPTVLSADQGGHVTVSVSNHRMVTIGEPGSGCPVLPGRGTPYLNQTRKAVHIELNATAWGTVTTTTVGTFGRTARLTTAADPGGTITGLAGTDATAVAAMTIRACDVSGFRNQSVTLTIDGAPSPGGLVEVPHLASRGDITIGSPLTVTVDSNESAPTLSFSPTDVTIDEGDSVSTRLIADGTSATEVGVVKLMVEGDAMVHLYHEDTMLEEMDGYVMVDMGRNNSARLTAMSMESRELQDGDMAYKAWKLVDGSSDAMIGDDSWFRVDVRGSTAVPALPLIGQLLLALFLMAGGSRLYRRRRG